MEAHRRMDPYSRPVITYLGLAYGLADISFTFTLFSIDTLLFTLNSQLVDTNYSV